MLSSELLPKTVQIKCEQISKKYITYTKTQEKDRLNMSEHAVIKI